MTTINIHDVPDELGRQLEASAARSGRSLSDYLLAVLFEAVERPPLIGEPPDRPPLDELRARLRSRTPIDPSVDIVAIIREARGPL